MLSKLIPPLGAKLVNLIVDDERSAALKAQSIDLPSWHLTPRQICNVELLLCGGLSPLQGFMRSDQHQQVCSQMRLPDGMLWPLPVSLDVSEETARNLKPQMQLALRDLEGVVLAVQQVEDVFRPDVEEELIARFGTADHNDPEVVRFRRETHLWRVGGRLYGLQLPSHYDFIANRRTPRELRNAFARGGWRKVVAFITTRTMHKKALHLTFQTARQLQANLLIQPLVGLSSPEDIDYYARVRSYQALMPHYPRNTAMLNLLPWAPSGRGLRELVLYLLLSRNYGCTHLLLGEDLQSCWPEAAELEQLKRCGEELEVQALPHQKMVYVDEYESFEPAAQLPEYVSTKDLSTAQLQDMLSKGHRVPSWFSYPEVIAELRKALPPRPQQGFCVFFTGLPCSGKSTLANVLRIRLLEIGGRPVTLLDGDIVRKYLSSELGFSKEHRDINIRRIGFVASEITKNRGIAICAPIAPYHSVRTEVREMVEKRGGFVLVHVATPLEVCETRDRKGMYRKARAGVIGQFTGISDPYESPEDAEVRIDTSEITPEAAAQRVLLYLEKAGYIGVKE